MLGDLELRWGDLGAHGDNRAVDWSAMKPSATRFASSTTRTQRGSNLKANLRRGAERQPASRVGQDERSNGG